MGMSNVAETLAVIFIWVVGLLLLLGVVLFIIDISQTKDAVRRNYPVIGRFRHIFSELGDFFRQYFFAMDREEMPFNRAQREWVDRAASGKGNTVAFGSTKNLQPVGTPIFVNCAWPTLDEDAVEAEALLIGARARAPYLAPSYFNISAMSYGSLSKPALRALSLGAAKAGCWLNTGEGGLTPYHLEGDCDVIFQIGTAKYGVRTEDGELSDEKLKAVAAHPQVKMFELKLSQGAKPGKGGILPAEKVSEEIAKIRGIRPHEASTSPNRHPEIDSIEDLCAMIQRLRDVTGKPVGIKFVVGAYGWLLS
ncbi:MAG: FMN-binding glutamate synthase family protein, partial [Erythrobacter sp.]|nr:FMN-binding glutamate synthase family protein [Erythrobacter sp.]